MKQVYIPDLFGRFNVINENALWYAAIDCDGINHVVYKPSAVVRGVS